MPSGWQPGKPTLPPESETLTRAGHAWEIWKTDMAFWYYHALINITISHMEGSIFG